MNFACWLVRVGLVLGLGVLGGACHTTPKSGRHLASVLVPGKGLTEIREVARQVFEEEGYTGTWGVRSMVFHRPGSTMDNLAYGGWNLSSVTVRAELALTEEINGDYRIVCDAYLVRDAGDHVFEDSHKVTAKGKYQKLLNRIRERLAKS